MTKRWVALFRGINVGGNNRIKMADLCEAVTAIEAVTVASYIQSGNVVFDHASADADVLRARLIGEVERVAGFTPPDVFVLTAEKLTAAVENCPLPTDGDPALLHVYFMQSTVQLDEAAVSALATSDERIELVDDVAYLATPNGYSRSRLAAKLPVLLGQSYTARNWRTMGKIRELADG